LDKYTFSKGLSALESRRTATAALNEIEHAVKSLPKASTFEEEIMEQENFGKGKFFDSIIFVLSAELVAFFSKNNLTTIVCCHRGFRNTSKCFCSCWAA
jgi:hypothetical protein